MVPTALPEALTGTMKLCPPYALALALLKITDSNEVYSNSGLLRGEFNEKSLPNNPCIDAQKTDLLIGLENVSNSKRKALALNETFICCILQNWSKKGHAKIIFRRQVYQFFP